MVAGVGGVVTMCAIWGVKSVERVSSSQREMAARSQQGDRGAICGVMVRVATESPQHHHSHTTAKYSILAAWIDQNM